MQVCKLPMIPYLMLTYLCQYFYGIDAFLHTLTLVKYTLSQSHGKSSLLAELWLDILFFVLLDKIYSVVVSGTLSLTVEISSWYKASIPS